jgi:hypothetical protein
MKINISKYYNISNQMNPHHAEGLVNPKVRAQKKVTLCGYPRAQKTSY